MGTAPVIALTRGGEALRFGGINDAVNCGDDISLTTRPQITLELWVRSESLQGVGAGVSTTGRNTYLLALVLQGHVLWNIWNGANEVFPFWSGQKLIFNEWHHLVGTYDGEEARIYIDGQLDSAKPFVGDLAPNGQEFWIGMRNTNKPIPATGIIDEVRVYDRALSAAEIAQNLASDGLAVESGGKLGLVWGRVKAGR